MKPNNNKVQIIRVIILVCMLSLPFGDGWGGVYAQPGGVGGGQGQGGPPPGSGAVPIDGGLLILVAGAALYGKRMMHSHKP